jgi:hypothetical protein
MPFCTNCGSTINPDHKFCSSCGTPTGINSATKNNPEVVTIPSSGENEAYQPISDEIRWTNSVLGMKSDYFVNKEGAGLAAASSTSAMTTGITAAGVLLGSMTAAGAGMLVKSRETDFIAWDNARSVALNAKKKTVTVTRKSFIAPIRLYCLEENYRSVEDFIRQNVNPAIVKG